MTPDQRTAIYDKLNRVIAKLYSANCAAAGFADFGRPSQYLKRWLSRKLSPEVK